ncbi:sensor histidine kinase [Isoptericola variabilis]|uniref:histidine kinase n=1 Tax=Isoptericola variabilis (strain 225) TaxID=743718 RepID=F6FT32_ISOV2|nr:ATP-binding protein [Isoptericola variabilis]AEG44103.1 putative signal transduction histidine kinase [Isoptericola variabilis 225]TWH28792.1 histidine kinase [Isoptericola variabilis J7]
MTAIAVRAQAGQVAAAPDAAVDALRVIEAEARRTLGEMRSLVHVLRDDTWPGADLGGLDPLDAVAGLAAAGPPEVRVHVSDDLRPLEPATAAAVFRTAQEAVTNARRHARGASRVDVTVDRADGAVRLRVHDDGTPAGHPGTGYGLPGMAERAALPRRGRPLGVRVGAPVIS